MTHCVIAVKNHVQSPYRSHITTIHCYLQPQLSISSSSLVQPSWRLLKSHNTKHYLTTTSYSHDYIGPEPCGVIVQYTMLDFKATLWAPCSCTHHGISIQLYHRLCWCPLTAKQYEWYTYSMISMMYLFTTEPHLHGHWQLQELLGSLLGYD